MADSGESIREQVLMLLGKCLISLLVISMRRKSDNEAVLEKYTLIYQTPTMSQGNGCIRWGALQKYIVPEVHVSFELQVLQIPTYSQVGDWGLTLLDP